MQNPQLYDTWRSAVLAGNDTLTDAAVEEVLRASSVTTHFRRTATCDVEIRDAKVRAGDKVVLYYVSADHDEDRFARPFRFDLARSDNEHMAFGAQWSALVLGRLVGAYGTQSGVRGAAKARGSDRAKRAPRAASLQLHLGHQTAARTRGRACNVRALVIA